MDNTEDEARILRQDLETTFKKRNIPLDQREALNKLLESMRNYHLPTHNHMVRVGLIADKVEPLALVNTNSLLYPALTHDIGKLRIRLELLNKTNGWTEQDSDEMRYHALYGFEILRNKFLYSAYSAAYSHIFNLTKVFYLPPFPPNFSEAVKVAIMHSARIVSIIDSRDAAVTRANDRNNQGNPRSLTREGALDMLMKECPDKKELIEKLVEQGIF
jgi:hypothetical protein